VKQFQTERNARYVVFLYKANQFSGTLTSSDEGEVFWANRNQLYEYNLVADFQELLDVFEKPDLNEFFYTKENGNWLVNLI
jgi:8-oxo-dGTP diphosphatase